MERQVEDLKRLLREKQNVVDEKEEELYVLTEKAVSFPTPPPPPPSDVYSPSASILM